MQIPEGPDSVIALQWVIIVALSTVVAYLYRRSLRREEEYHKSAQEQLEKTRDGLSENTQAIKEVVIALKALSDQFSLRKEIQDLRREVGRGHD